MVVTIKDVAKKAGVSISTVSKVINDSPTISGPTKIKVKEVMKELNYYPNSIARSFVHQNSCNIGILMELKRSYAFVNPYLYEILGGIEEVAQENGYFLTLLNINSLTNDKSALDKIIMGKRFDGLIIHVAALTKSIARRLEETEFPFIVVGQPDFECGICWVDINNKLAGEIATNHLIDEGYKRIAFVGGAPEDRISLNRQNGYKSALQNKGVKLNKNYIKEGAVTSEEGFRLFGELLDLPVPPDSIVFTNNFIAFGGIKAIKSRGLRIPEDIALVGFDNYPLSQFTEPQLTVVDIDVFELGVQAANTLMNKLKNPNIKIQYSMLSPTLIVRDSSRKK